MQNFRASHLFPQSSFDSTESRVTAETANVRTLEAKTARGSRQFLGLAASNWTISCVYSMLSVLLDVNTKRRSTPARLTDPLYISISPDHYHWDVESAAAQP